MGKNNTPNKHEGLGIQRLNDKNNAILASTTWKLFYNLQILWAAILISKYITTPRYSLKKPLLYGNTSSMAGRHVKLAYFGTSQKVPM